MLRHFIRFSVLLFFSVGISFLLHSFIYVQLFPHKSVEILEFSYKFNFGITYLFTSTIILASNKIKDQLGFIFIAGGFIKLGIFLYLVNTFHFSIGKTMFLHFFIPYLVCMAVEIFSVLKILNSPNSA